MTVTHLGKARVVDVYNVWPTCNTAHGKLLTITSRPWDSGAAHWHLKSFQGAVRFPNSPAQWVILPLLSNSVLLSPELKVLIHLSLCHQPLTAAIQIHILKSFFRASENCLLVMRKKNSGEGCAGYEGSFNAELNLHTCRRTIRTGVTIY